MTTIKFIMTVMAGLIMEVAEIMITLDHTGTYQNLLLSNAPTRRIAIPSFAVRIKKHSHKILKNLILKKGTATFIFNLTLTTTYNTINFANSYTKSESYTVVSY